MTKAVGELLVNDYSRKGFIDGRSARLSTVIVRPGKPNKAASSFVSAVIREPLNGVDYELPVNLDTMMAVVGYRTVVEGIIALYEVGTDALGDDRAVNLPNISVTVAEMVESLKRVAVGRKLGRISVKVDPFVAPIVAGWPTHVDASRAAALALPQDAGVDPIIRAYIADYL
jgi:nucleoside-diphosphate-sugar epimerase